MMRMFHGMDLEKVKGATFDRATIRRVWRFVGAYHRRIYAYLVVIAASSLLGVLPPLVFRRLIDVAIPTRDMASVNRLAALALVLSAASAGLSLLGSWLAVRVGEGLIYDLRAALYEHVLRMPIAFFTRTQTGALTSRLNNDVVGAQQAVTSTLATTVSSGLGLAFTLAAMIALSWRITLLCLLLVPAFLVLSKRVGRRVSALSREQMQLNASMNTTMTERFNVAGALLVKLFGRPETESSDFNRRARRVADAGVRRAMLGRTFGVSLGLLASLGTAAVYWFGARAVVQGGFTIGTMVAFAAYVQRIYDPIINLTTTRVDLLSALVSFERVFEVLDAPLAIDDLPGAAPLPKPAAGRVEVDDVWFRYPAGSTYSIASLEAEGTGHSDDAPSEWVLRGVSLVAEPGTMTALVGPSGGGKTTLASLVSRLHDVTSGAVRVDGHDVREVTLASLAAVVGVVSQDAHLFHESIAANLRYAKPSATDAELQDACRAARIHDVIAALPDGYATIVGERGYRLSGGEKQRLAIARVLLKAPAIVILDEATAHLDSESEVHIQRALATALEARTSIVIAHRLSTIVAADQILVIDGGRIVERGTHDELLSRGGLYAELYETQYHRGTAAETA